MRLPDPCPGPGPAPRPPRSHSYPSSAPQPPSASAAPRLEPRPLPRTWRCGRPGPASPVLCPALRRRSPGRARPSPAAAGTPPPWSTPAPFPPGSRRDPRPRGRGGRGGAWPSHRLFPSGITPFPSSSELFILPGTKGVCSGVGGGGPFPAKSRHGGDICLSFSDMKSRDVQCRAFSSLFPGEGTRRKLSEGFERIRQSSLKEELCS